MHDSERQPAEDRRGQDDRAGLDAADGCAAAIAAWLDDAARTGLLLEAGPGYHKSRRCRLLDRLARERGYRTLLIEAGGAVARPKERSAIERIDAFLDDPDGSPSLLIIEGYDRLAVAKDGRAVADRIVGLPPHVRIAISSRARIDIRFGRRWLGGRIARLDAGALSLDRANIAALFGSDPASEFVEALWAWSEGWPLAVEAAHLCRQASASGTVSADEVIARARSDVERYLRDEIVADLDPAQRSLLMSTCFLEAFDCELGQALTGETTLWELLEDLVRRHIVVDRGEEEGTQRYRCHPLLRGAMRAELSKRGRGELIRLARIAAQWFWQQRDVQRAVSCAHIAGDGAMAAQWALSLDTAMLGIASGERELRGLMEHVPLDILSSNPKLALAQAFLAAKTNRINLATRILEEVRASMAEAALLADPMIARDLAIVEVAIAMYNGEGLNSSALPAVRMIEALTRDDESARGFIENLLCAIAIYDSDFPEAIARCHTAQHFYARQGSQNGLGYIYLHAARIHAEMLDSDQALTEYRQACEHFLHLHTPEEQPLRLLKPLRARLHYDLGQFEEARGLCDLFAQELEKGGYYCEALYAGFRTAARVIALRDGAADAVQHVREAIGFARMQRFTQLEHLLSLELALIEPDQNAFLRHCSDEMLHPARDGSQQPWRVRDLQAQVRARRAGALGDVEEAIRTLDRQLRECRAQGRSRTQIDLLVCAARIHDEAQQRDQALESLRQAVRLARKGDVVAPFVENGRDVVALLSLLGSGGAGGEASRSDQSFIGGVMRIDGSVNSGPAALLSQREHEVLSYLARGMSNKLIARELSISPETVRYHLKGIYDKFGLNGGYANRRALTQFLTQSPQAAQTRH